MNAQIDFDFSKNVHKNDPITSYEAAEKVHAFANSHFNIIFQVLLGCGGLTAQKISDKCDLGYHQVARRLSEMAKKGLVERTAEKRKTRSGSNSFVWRVK